MVEVKAGNARNSRAVAKFSKAIAPACAPYLHPYRQRRDRLFWTRIDCSCFDQRFLKRVLSGQISWPPERSYQALQSLGYLLCLVRK